MNPLAPQPRKAPGEHQIVPAGKEALPEIYAGFGADVQGVLAALGQKRLKQRSYLDMVEPQYKSIVVDLAERAFPEKGAGRSIGEFKEVMAQNWLAKREIFNIIGEKSGFTPVTDIPINTPSAGMALTQNGSIVLFGSPKQGGDRDLAYMRISAREKSNIDPISSGFLRKPPEVGLGFRTTEFNTSAVMELLTSAAPKVEMSKTMDSIRGSFIDVDHRTIF